MSLRLQLTLNWLVSGAGLQTRERPPVALQDQRSCADLEVRPTSPDRSRPIDDQDFERRFAAFQLQPELFLNRRE